MSVGAVFAHLSLRLVQYHPLLHTLLSLPAGRDMSRRCQCQDVMSIQPDIGGQTIIHANSKQILTEHLRSSRGVLSLAVGLAPVGVRWAAARTSAALN